MSKTPPWADYFTMDNLPNEDMKIIAEIIGLSNVITLMCEVPGFTFTVPKNATRKAKISYIKQNYDGSKLSRYKLAKTCNISENYIYRAIKKK